MDRTSYEENVGNIRGFKKKTGSVETSQKDGLVDCGINNSKMIVFLFFYMFERF
jgi:hypothetical protein